MGKITVKHYLNTDVKKITTTKVISSDVGDGIAYLRDENGYFPIYLQITVNRKTTKIRSLTHIRLSKKEYKQYSENEPYDSEQKTIFVNGTLKEELDFVHRILEYFINIKNYDYTKYDIRDIITYYSDRVQQALVPYANKYIKDSFHRNAHIADLSKIIDFKSNYPKDIISILNKTLSFDLTTFLTEREKQCIDCFSYFISLLPEVYLTSVNIRLIDWLNGHLKDDFMKNLAISKLGASTAKEYLSIMDEMFQKADKDFFLFTFSIAQKTRMS